MTIRIDSGGQTPSPPPAASSSATSNTRQMGAGLSKGQSGEAGRAVPAGSRARVMNAAPRNGVGSRRLSLPLPSAPLLSAGSVPRLLRASQSSCCPEKPPATSAREQAQASQSQVRRGGSCSLGDGVQTAASRHPPPVLGVSPCLLHFSSSFTVWVVGFWRPWVCGSIEKTHSGCLPVTPPRLLPMHRMREGHYPGGTLP